MNSMDSIDVKNRKPRKFKGTPAYRLRNQLAVVAVVYALVAGAVFMFSPLTQEVRDSPTISRARREELEDEPEEERLRNKSMILAFYQAQQAKKHQEQAKKFPNSS